LLIHERTAENQPTPELTRDLNLIAKSSQALGQFEAAAESLKRAMYLTERQLNADPRATAAMLLQFGRLEIAWQRPVGRA
jgi:hypothetical protein